MEIQRGLLFVCVYYIIIVLNLVYLTAFFLSSQKKKECKLSHSMMNLEQYQYEP